jgi:hypothetical protein
MREPIDSASRRIWSGRTYVRRGAREDVGAVLVLALVFMTATGMLVLGLLSWSGNDISNVAAFQQSRAVNSAANSAMETAIQEVRYSSTTCPNTGLSFSVNSVTIDISCSPNPEVEGGTAASRVITFTACPSTAFTVTGGVGACTTPYLEAVVTYDDYSSSNQIATSAACSTTCGATMTINSWIFQQTAI